MLRKDWVIDLYNWCTSDHNDMEQFDSIFLENLEFKGEKTKQVNIKQGMSRDEYKKAVYYFLITKGHEPIIAIS